MNSQDVKLFIRKGDKAEVVPLRGPFSLTTLGPTGTFKWDVWKPKEMTFTIKCKQSKDLRELFLTGDSFLDFNFAWIERQTSYHFEMMRKHRGTNKGVHHYKRFMSLVKRFNLTFKDNGKGN